MSTRWIPPQTGCLPPGRHRLDARLALSRLRVRLSRRGDQRQAAGIANRAGRYAGSRRSDNAGHVERNAHALSWSSDGKRLAFLYVEGATRRASAVAAAKPASGEIGVDGLEVQARGNRRYRRRRDTACSRRRPAMSMNSAGHRTHERIAYIAAPAPGDNNWWIAKLYAQSAQVQCGADGTGGSRQRDRFAAWLADRPSPMVTGWFAHRLHRRTDERPGIDRAATSMRCLRPAAASVISRRAST